VTRARTWSSNRSLEWARRLGASPPKRITASWSGSSVEPTEYKCAARSFAPYGRLPSVRLRSQPQYSNKPPPIQRRRPHSSVTHHCGLIETSHANCCIETRSAPKGFRDVTIWRGPMPRKSIGERALTDAERQARYRYRATRAVGAPTICTRLPDRTSRRSSHRVALAGTSDAAPKFA